MTQPPQNATHVIQQFAQQILDLGLQYLNDQQIRDLLQKNNWDTQRSLDQYLNYGMDAIPKPHPSTQLPLPPTGAPRAGAATSMSEEEQIKQAMALSIQQQSQVEAQTGLNTISNEEAELARVIEESLKQNPNGPGSNLPYEPLNPEQRKREENVPVGLQNIGNTCYFNSLLQIYFTIPGVVEAVMSHKDNDEDVDMAPQNKPKEEHKGEENKNDGIDKEIEKRVTASKKLIQALKKLFASMAKSNKKYADPTNVLNAIVDEYGNKIQIGEQKDIGEFNNVFLARIQEGLHADQIMQKLRQEREEAKAVSELPPIDVKPSDVEMNSSTLEQQPAQQSPDQDVVMIDTSQPKIPDSPSSPSKDLKRVLTASQKSLSLTPMKSMAQRTEQEGGAIADTFFGQYQSFIFFNDKEGLNRFQEVSETFVEIMVSVLGTNDMFEAIERMCQDTIEGYQTLDGETTQAKKVDYIKKLPKVLCMQFNRLTFKEGNANKDLSPLAIEKVFYADRLMIENKNEIEKIRNYVQSLREKIHILEQKLREYQKFHDSDYNIQKLLQLAATFFREQAPFVLSQEERASGLELYSPLSQPDFAKTPEISSVIGTLTKFADNTQKQIDILQRQLDEQHSLVDKAYAGLDSNPYHLHAVCIHDGNAYSGHYYAFIRDRFNNKWRRFNDIRVTDATEEEVFKEANGGHGWMTAYWGVYVNEEIHQQLQNIDLYSYIPPEKRGESLALEHPYCGLIPGIVNIQVEDDNLKLLEEIKNYQSTQLLNAIKKRYDDRYQEIQSINQLVKNKDPFIGHIQHANIYAYFNWLKEESILSKILLDVCVREEIAKLYGVEESLFTMREDSALFKKIKAEIIGQSPKYPKNGPQLDQGEQNKFDKNAKEYNIVKRDIYMTNQVLGKLDIDDIKSSLQWVRTHYDMMLGFSKDNNYQKVTRDAGRVGLLKLCTFINKDLSTGVQDPELYIDKLLTIYEAVKMYDKTDSHRTQIINQLKHTLTLCEGVLKTQGSYDDFSRVLNAIEHPDQPFNPQVDLHTFGKSFTFMPITNQDDIQILERVKNFQTQNWYSIFEENEAPIQYQKNFEKFKTNCKVWIDIHFQVVKNVLINPEEVAQREKDQLQIDIKSIA